MSEKTPFFWWKSNCFSLFCYVTTLLDNLLQDREIHEDSSAVFKWVREENLPSSLASILLPTLLGVTFAPTCSWRREIVRNIEKKKQQERHKQRVKGMKQRKEKRKRGMVRVRVIKTNLFKKRKSLYFSWNLCGLGTCARPPCLRPLEGDKADAILPK